MQTCYNCGKQVADEVLICPDCGALVKRYNTPPQQEDTEPTPAAARGHLSQTPDGKLRLSGGITAWLVIALVMAGYLAVSMFCSIYISGNETLFTEMFAPYPELEPLTQLISQLADAIRTFYVFFLALGILLAAKFAIGIWFLAVKSRLAHTSLIVCTAILAAILIIFGGGFYAIWMLGDALITALVLRADRANMR